MARFASLAGVAVVAIAGLVGAPKEAPAGEGLPIECLAAETYAAERIRSLLLRSDVQATWRVGSSLTGLKIARGHCLNGQSERAMAVYYRVIDILESDPPAGEPEVAATPPDDGRAGP